MDTESDFSLIHYAASGHSLSLKLTASIWHTLSSFVPVLCLQQSLSLS